MKGMLSRKRKRGGKEPNPGLSLAVGEEGLFTYCTHLRKRPALTSPQGVGKGGKKPFLPWRAEGRPKEGDLLTPCHRKGGKELTILYREDLEETSIPFPKGKEKSPFPLGLEKCRERGPPLPDVRKRGVHLFFL